MLRSRARFSVLRPATHYPGSSLACRRRLADATEPSIGSNVCRRRARSRASRLARRPLGLR
eukprot:278839-Prymnesium_polylepis.1